MKPKTKLFAIIAAFCFVMGFCIFEVFALSELVFTAGGSLNFIVSGVEVTVGQGRFEKDNGDIYPNVLPTMTNKMSSFTVGANTTETQAQAMMESWQDLDMTLREDDGDCTMVIPITNNNPDKILGVEISVSIPEGVVNKNDNLQILVQSGTVAYSTTPTEFEIKFDIIDTEEEAGVADFDIFVHFTKATEEVGMTVDTVMVGNTAITPSKGIYEVGEAIQFNQNVTLPANQTTDIVLPLSNPTDKKMTVIVEHTAPDGVTVETEEVVLEPNTKQNYTISVVVSNGSGVNLSNLGLSVKLEKAIEGIIYDMTVPGASTWNVSIENGQATVDNYSGDFEEDIVVPDYVKTNDGIFPVTKVGMVMASGPSEFYSGKLTISHNVITIGSNAFGGFTGLSGDLVIPASVETIEYNAFKMCCFNTVICLGTVPPEIDVDSIPDCSVIYVPENCVEVYKTAWSEHAGKIQAMP